MIKDQAIQRLVERLVNDRLFDGAVQSVEIEADVDHDGDPILRVRVILSDRVGERQRNLSGIVRRLRPKLAEIDEKRFPLMSFISAGDKTEAA